MAFDQRAWRAVSEDPADAVSCWLSAPHGLSLPWSLRPFGRVPADTRVFQHIARFY